MRCLLSSLLINYVSFICSLLIGLQDGCDPKRVDKLVQKLGFPVGPMVLNDEVGMDVGAHIGLYLADTFGERFGIGKDEMLMYKEVTDKGSCGKCI